MPLKQKFEFQRAEEDELTLESAIGQAIGAASVCWLSETGLGVFDSDRAKEIAETTIDWVKEHELDKPRLGCATTEQLLEEISARLWTGKTTPMGLKLAKACDDALASLDKDLLDYRTVDSQ